MREFISKNYPTSICADTTRLGCLCTQRSLSGATLGDAGIRCVLSSCPFPTNEDLRVYEICQGIEGAIPNTHPTSTLPGSSTLAPSATPQPTRTSRLDPPIKSSMSVTGQDKIGVNTTAFGTIIGTATQTAATSRDEEVLPGTSASPPAHSPSQETQPEAIPLSQPLSQGKIIGASVGGSAACIFGIALLILLLLRRRKHRGTNRQENDNFEIGGTMAEPSPRLLRRNVSHNNRIPSTPIGAYNRSTFEPLTAIPGLRLHSSFGKTAPGATNLSQAPYEQGDIDDIELGSPSSMRTLSRLLPDKPDLEDYGRQHPITEKLTSARPSSSITIFEEDSDGRRPQSLEGHSTIFKMRKDRANEGPLLHENSLDDRYLTPYVPTTTHNTQSKYNLQSDAALQKNDIMFTDPFSGKDPVQPSQQNSVNSSSPISFRYSPSIYSSSRSRDGEDTEAGKSGRCPRKAILRHSAASSTTSFETVASDDEGTNAKTKLPVKKLSPVKESTSHQLASSRYLQVPRPINYSRSLRRTENLNSTFVKHDNPNRPPWRPTHHERQVERTKNLHRFPVKPSPVANPSRISTTSEASAGRFLHPDDPHADHTPRSPWERNVDFRRRGPKLVLRTS
ncbi:hypothetical protein LOZ17_002075 [Ophidiomyces ophidiicola]|nr:hypothetical protein LOZ42_005441 [Ophidiomyces ophidiicola]KAI2125719.1 hypothetical protein LOZ32_000558 [Ophidiomyces ophidiicola]KAI2191141.1 hypothetical protein LOZ21_001775 [Ophidiomyces ophidiicola]KAI2221616.1 hypothetical protein LOZ17_002075 [Ophidiomyces ophidiicola]